MNLNEFHTDQQLRQLETTRPARVAEKMDLKDVWPISQSGLTPTQYRYALMAHFDNVVYDNTDPVRPEPLFAVEFDGPSHLSTDAQRRDALKDSICNHFSFPLLRVDADFLQERKPRVTLLTWLSELWFEYQEFEEAQRRGDVPIDAPFHYDYMFVEPSGGFGFLWDAAQCRRSIPPSSSDLEDADDEDESRSEAFAFRPFVLHSAERWSLGSAQHHGSVLGAGEWTVGTVNGRAAASLVLKVDDGYIVGRATCKRFDFPPIRDLEVAQELAIRDADVRFTRWLCMEEAAVSAADVDRIRGQIVRTPDAPFDNRFQYVKTGFGFTTLDKMMEVAEREISK